VLLTRTETPAAPPSGFRRYDDVEWDDVPELLLHGGRRCSQLTPGTLLVSYRVAHAGRCAISELTLSGSAILRGEPMEGVARLVLPDLPPGSCATWAGLPMRSNSAVSTLGEPSDWSIQGPARLLEICVDLGPRHAPWLASSLMGPLIRQQGALVCEPRARLALAGRIRSVLNGIESEPAWRASAGRLLVESGVLHTALDALGLARRACDPSAGERQRRLFSHLLNLAASHGELLSLDLVANSLCVSKRSLNYYCHDFFGVAPMELMRLARLSSVRRSLRARHAPDRAIWKTAGDYGFWHPGRFAVAYREHFGESPSQTVRRRNRGDQTAPVRRPAADVA
jgi:AraC-like DNA-binding protein